MSQFKPSLPQLPSATADDFPLMDDIESDASDMASAYETDSSECECHEND